MGSTEDKIDRFVEIMEEIKEMHQEAMQIVRSIEPDRTYSRAKGYWGAQIAMALDDDHEYLGSGSCTMADTAEELADVEGGE